MPPKSKKIIDCASLIDETLVTVADAVHLFPNKPARDSLERYFRFPVAPLESLSIGSKRFTSREAIRRFIIAQANCPSQPDKPQLDKPKVSGKASVAARTPTKSSGTASGTASGTGRMSPSEVTETLMRFGVEQREN